MNHISDTTDIGITFQMTLDAFLDETHPVKDTNQNTYRDALKKLEEANHCRSSQKKQTIAREALGICTDCIEAYLVLGINEQNMYRKLGMLKEGMELATMNLGKDFFLRDASDFFEFDEAKLRKKYPDDRIDNWQCHLGGHISVCRRTGTGFYT